MAKGCAFRDCGDPQCHLCKLARIPSHQVSRRLADGIRSNAKATLDRRTTKRSTPERRKIPA